MELLFKIKFVMGKTSVIFCLFFMMIITINKINLFVLLMCGLMEMIGCFLLFNNLSLCLKQSLLMKGIRSRSSMLFDSTIGLWCWFLFFIGILLLVFQDGIYVLSNLCFNVTVRSLLPTTAIDFKEAFGCSFLLCNALHGVGELEDFTRDIMYVVGLINPWGFRVVGVASNLRKKFFRFDVFLIFYLVHCFLVGHCTHLKLQNLSVVVCKFTLEIV